MIDSLCKIKKNEFEKASLVLGKLPLFFEVSLRHALKYGGVYAPSENLEGIAIILPYETADMTSERLLRSGALRPMKKLGRETAGRVEEILAPIIKDQKEILKRVYLYLQTIGVSPELQGRDFGEKLLRAITEYADNEEIPIYLEITEEKFGF